jgi:hypothetical protein
MSVASNSLCGWALLALAVVLLVDDRVAAVLARGLVGELAGLRATGPRRPFEITVDIAVDCAAFASCAQFRARCSAVEGWSGDTPLLRLVSGDSVKSARLRALAPWAELGDLAVRGFARVLAVLVSPFASGARLAVVLADALGREVVLASRAGEWGRVRGRGRGGRGSSRDSSRVPGWVPGWESGGVRRRGRSDAHQALATSANDTVD